MSSLLTGMSEFYHAIWQDLYEPARTFDGRPGGHGPFDILTVWEERVRFRRQLAKMAEQTPELLNDVGLTKVQVFAETTKPFWRR
ncbi:DUF1127 domain-containing protein [Ensifer sp. LC163]|uniref:DUF1127 domain-containing protein n=1 Tax=Ensifer sp. LC163 TaxID=1120652 RepID=UPI000813B236|nr:hypothetical protein [Ensifer sp. LC163]OCP38917.1 hypothetical protein BC360_02405 [Ensifer sp. LC163]